MNRQFILFLFCVFSAHILMASTTASITGVIRDAQSGEPLAYTNVFFANTTMGDAADEDGIYVLENVPPGHYQLVFSRIGYEMQVQELLVLPNQSRTVNAKLNVMRLEGEEVRVEAEKNSRQWRRHLREFEREFLGSTSNAGDCKITNPHVLSFQRKRYDLIATAEQPIVVENAALGYRLDIVLASFRWGLGRGQFIIYPKYTEMQAKNDRQLNKWRSARAETFHASLRDFFATFYHGELFPRYKIQKAREEASGTFKSSALDSMHVEKLTSARDLMRYISADILRVEHWNGGVSTIDLKYDYIDFDQWGNIYPPDGVRVSGNWGQYRVADSLPFNYHPDDEP